MGLVCLISVWLCVIYCVQRHLSTAPYRTGGFASLLTHSSGFNEIQSVEKLFVDGKLRHSEFE